MRRRDAVAVGLLAAIVGVEGCKVGPAYKTPAMPAPPAYSENGANGNPQKANGNWSVAAPADDKSRSAWWTVYNDAELNRLEEQCASANLSIAAASQAYEQSHALVMSVRSALFPTVSLGATATRNRISSYRPLRPVTAPNYYWDFLIPLSVSWEPDIWGRVRSQIDSASASAQASAADLANTRLSLQGTLAASYFQVRGIDLQVKLLRSTVDAYKQTLTLTEDRRKGGLASESDVEQAKTQLESTRAQTIDAGVQRAKLEHAIAVLIGVPAQTYKLSELPLAGDPPAIPAGVPSQLLQRRPDIAMAERRVASANAQIGIQKAAYYPNISLGAAGGIESSDITTLIDSNSTLWNAGPSASEILFDAGQRKANVKAAVAQREQAADLYRQQVLSAFRDVEDQLSALRILAEEADVQQRAVLSAERSTELSVLRYKRGLAPYLEVLTNQTIQLSNERVSAGLVADRIVASVALQVALGGGWDAAELPKN
ncbi:MAG: efflux transporter outer membrane subunit [Edaphobacter sp.]|uniref:efflux transporter outer membrane subunit n=1 Tax=Edaphobacter sp. TaxID=1934404 RepID=UPI00238D330E|nr:efflux transporter outer membrane subunit [Edaphobacter sp.]MDE1178459.1 efflux transporter outer membrane subunit [Edaphobacter sp.]